MHFNHTIPPEKENRWTAFLNGEPDIQEFSNQEAQENAGLTSVWETTGNNFSFEASDPDLAWQNLRKEMVKADQKRSTKLFNSPLFKFAATIIVAFGLGFSVYQYLQKPASQIVAPIAMTVAQTAAHPVGFTVLTLPDGSSVKMNANTRIEYPKSFASDVRKIKLSGEAFFEVTRDTERPFIIDTQYASVEVLGTSFNVSAYPQSGLVEVNVETGKVKLTQHIEGKSGSTSALLPAGTHGWVKIADGVVLQEELLAPNYSAWINKVISFQRTPLAEAFEVLENTYHVKIQMQNSEIGTIPYTANFADLNLDYIIEVIARTHNLSVKRNGGEIIFARIKN